jgi:hypothetical protein
LKWPVAGLIRGDPEKPEANKRQAKFLKGLATEFLSSDEAEVVPNPKRRKQGRHR